MPGHTSECRCAAPLRYQDKRVFWEVQGMKKVQNSSRSFEQALPPPRSSKSSKKQITCTGEHRKCRHLGEHWWHGAANQDRGNRPQPLADGNIGTEASGVSQPGKERGWGAQSPLQKKLIYRSLEVRAQGKFWRWQVGQKHSIMGLGIDLSSYLESIFNMIEAGVQFCFFHSKFPHTVCWNSYPFLTCLWYYVHYILDVDVWIDLFLDFVFCSIGLLFLESVANIHIVLTSHWRLF